MALIHCCECQREVPDRAEQCPYCGAEPIKVRGLATILVTAVAGLVLGMVGALVIMAIRNANGGAVLPLQDWLAAGACYGTVGGAVLGAIFWAVFPYKGLTRPAESTLAVTPPAECLEGCDGHDG